MGRICQQRTLLKDADGAPILGADGKRAYKLRSKHWWIQYQDANHTKHRESSKSEKITDARKLLALREGARERGEPVGAKVNRISFDDAVKAVVADYKMKGRATADDVQRRIDLHLAPYFGGRLMAGIGSDEITKYVVARQTEGAEAATINRELAIIRRAFRLAVKAKKLLFRPDVELLPEEDARQGFFERAEFVAVRAALPDYLRNLVTFAYYSGWRRREILGLEFRQVDFENGIVKLEPSMTKTKRGRSFHFAPIDELQTALDEQKASAERIGKERDRIVATVFHHPDGTPIKFFRTSWANACTTAGYPGKMLHDFRRTAVRNLVRLDVPDTVAMAITGHKTRSVFDRYDISSESDLRDASAKLNGLSAAKSPDKKTARGRVRQFKQRAGKA